MKSVAISLSLARADLLLCLNYFLRIHLSKLFSWFQQISFSAHRLFCYLLRLLYFLYFLYSTLTECNNNGEYAPSQANRLTQPTAKFIEKICRQKCERAQTKTQTLHTNAEKKNSKAHSQIWVEGKDTLARERETVVLLNFKLTRNKVGPLLPHTLHRSHTQFPKSTQAICANARRIFISMNI